MLKKTLLGLGLVALLGVPAFAGERTGEMQSHTEWKTAPPEAQRRVRVNRGVYNLVGQQPDLKGICGPSGAASVRTKSNGWDFVFGIATVGLYTPQHVYVVCNPPTAG